MARERLCRLEAEIQSLSLLDPKASRPSLQQETSKENGVLIIVQAYYSQTVPNEASSRQFKLPEELRSIEFYCPVKN